MSREYCDHILDLLSPLGGVSAKRMFGGYGLFKSGLMFAIIAEDALYFKTADSNRGDFEAAGAAPFTYKSKGKTVTLSYWNAPAAALDDETELRDWARKACQAAAEAKPAAKKRSGKHGQPRI